LLRKAMVVISPGFGMEEKGMRASTLIITYFSYVPRGYVHSCRSLYDHTVDAFGKRSIRFGTQVFIVTCVLYNSAPQ
jgi:hypothetical protein